MIYLAKFELILIGPSGTNRPPPSPIREETDSSDDETTYRTLLAPRRPRLDSDGEEMAPSILYAFEQINTLTPNMERTPTKTL